MNALAIILAIASAQAPGPTIDGLIGSAKNAAGLEWAGTFLRLCIPPPPAQASAAGARGARGAAPAVPGRDTWYAEPAKVADNLYFLGTRIHSAWAIVGSDGIIILDNAYYKANTAANRKAGEANPFDVGKAAVGRYFTVVQDCTTAAMMRAAGQK